MYILYVQYKVHKTEILKFINMNNRFFRKIVQNLPGPKPEMNHHGYITALGIENETALKLGNQEGISKGKYIY